MTNDAHDPEPADLEPVSPAPAAAQEVRQPELLAIYLNDHLAGASGGVGLARRAAAAQRSSQHGPALAELADQVAADRRALRELMAAIDVPVRTYKVFLGQAAEKVGRLKLNGRVATRSPLSSLVELEGLALGIQAKLAGWRTLRVVAERDARLDWRRIDDLITGAQRQADVVESIRVTTATTLFGTSE